MTTTENPAPPQKTKVEKAQSYLGLVSTGLGVLGVVGTGIVWVTTTFMDGEVQINPDKTISALEVKVTDTQGHQKIYYGRNLWLFPGKYHLEFGVPDKQPTTHADATVSLWKKTEVPYVVPASLVEPEQPTEDNKSKKKWWQFWKHSSDKPSTNTDPN